MSEVPSIDDIIESQQDLQRKLWADKYYEQGKPIVRLLGDLSIELYRQISKLEQRR